MSRKQNSGQAGTETVKGCKQRHISDADPDSTGQTHGKYLRNGNYMVAVDSQ